MSQNFSNTSKNNQVKSDKVVNSSPAKIKLFFIKNDLFNTKSIELYLERREFAVKVETEFEGLLEKVEDFSPDYILLPWDHKDPNMRNFLSLIDTNQTPCIPYITSTATQDSRSLMQVNNPLKMFPPISGPSIQRMILKVEKTKLQKNQKGLQNTAAKNTPAQSQIYIAKGKRVGDLKKEHQKMLQGHMNSQYESNNSNQIHVKSMTLSSDLNKSRPGISSVNESENEIGNANLSQHTFDSITDLTTPIPISDFSPRMNLQISEVQKKSLAYKFDSKIQKNLISLVDTLQKNNNLNSESDSESESFDFNDSTSIYGQLVQSIDSSGLILFYSKWKIEIDEAENIMQDWSNDLLSHFLKGDHIDLNNYQSQVFDINFEPDFSHEDNILNICKAKSAVHKAIAIDGKMTILAFFDLKHNPFNIETARDDNYFIVDHNCISVPSRLYFDLYFEMKQNQKMIKIYKVDTEMTEFEIQAINQKKLIPLLVNSADEIKWFKYGIESYLKKP